MIVAMQKVETSTCRSFLRQDGRQSALKSQRVWLAAGVRGAPFQKQYGNKVKRSVLVHVVAEDVVFLRRSVKAGQHIQSAGDAVIAGDIEPGGSVAAIGDILVFGRLAGGAHAGSGGLRSATVKSLSMKDAKITIANTCAAVPQKADGATVVQIDPATGELLVQAAQSVADTRPDNALQPSSSGASQEAPGAVRRIATDTAGQSPQPGRAAVRAARQAPAMAALFTGGYAVIGGLALMLAPNTIFGLLFDASSVPTGWIRFGGVLLALIGMQYLGTAQSHPAARGFYLATVASRLFLVACCAVLVISQQLGQGLLVLAAVNLLGAAAMARALWREEQAVQAAD